MLSLQDLGDGLPWARRDESLRWGMPPLRGWVEASTCSFCPLILNPGSPGLIFSSSNPLIIFHTIPPSSSHQLAVVYPLAIIDPKEIYPRRHIREVDASRRANRPAVQQLTGQVKKLYMGLQAGLHL
jgi:hypothetical protein